MPISLQTERKQIPPAEMRE